MKHTNLSIIDRIAAITSAVILAGVPFYAILTVWGSQLIGHYTLLRLWPDLLLAVLAMYAGLQLKDRRLRHDVQTSKLFQLMAAYLLLTLALGGVALIKHEVTHKALAYGLLTNLRFFAWFSVIWIQARRNDWLHLHWRPIVLWPLTVVIGFGLLQFFVLPSNVLSHAGYSVTKTIAPAQTINQNTATIRVQSTLRGPNPLGAYIVLGACVVIGAYGVGHRRRGSLLFVAALVTLLLSFSRSAWLGALFSLPFLVYAMIRTTRYKRLLLVALTAGLLMAGIGFIILRNSTGVQDAVLHVSHDSTARLTSNAGHASAFRSGIKDIVDQPLGVGPGTAGPASVYNGDHGIRNSESYYLQIGQEIGLAGLLLFIVITVVIGFELWQRRTSPLALSLWASLIGLSVVSQLAYAWADPTLAYVWWGLAGIALAQPIQSQTEKRLSNA